jgi:hypothetical protein
LETLLKTGQELPFGGTVASIETISDVNDNGDLLAIIGLNRSNQRALILLPRNV